MVIVCTHENGLALRNISNKDLLNFKKPDRIIYDNSGMTAFKVGQNKIFFFVQGFLFHKSKKLKITFSYKVIANTNM